MNRLFISHAAESAERLALVDAVVSNLSEAGWHLFEYRRDVGAGQHWRVALLTALLNCDAAVVLDDERSRTRKWVRYEKGVLEARATTPFGACATVEIDLDQALTPQAIVSRVVAALPLDRTQETPALSAAVQDAIAAVASDLDDVQCKTCIEILMLQAIVGDLLQALPEHALVDVARRVHVAERSADAAIAALERLERTAAAALPTPRNAAVSAIARQLVSAPRDHLADFFESSGRFLPADRRRTLVQLLGPLFVPLAAVENLGKLFTRELHAPGPYAIAATTMTSATAAIRRAWGAERGLSFRAPIIEVTTTGEDPREIEDQVERALATHFSTEVGDRRIAEFAPRLRSGDQNEDLWWIVLPASQYTRGLSDWLAERYPDFSLLLIVDPDDPVPAGGALLAAVPPKADVMLRHLQILVSFDEDRLRG